MPLLPSPLQRILKRRSSTTASAGGAAELPARALRRTCPMPFAVRERWANYLAERPHLKALQLHLRAQGHRAVIVRDSIIGPGVQDERGSLHMTFAGMALREAQRTARAQGRLRKPGRAVKPTRPTWPLFTMWQDRRLVLLKKPQRRPTGLRSHR